MYARQSPWQGYTAASLRARIALAVGAVILTGVLCACVETGALVALGALLPSDLGGVSQAAGAPAAGVPVAPTATATATAAPTATAQPSPRVAPRGPPVAGATFGGPQVAFVATYGGDGVRYDINGITFGLNLTSGADGAPHVAVMLVYPSDAGAWTLDQAQGVCSAFLPPDATHVRDATDNEGDPEQIFASAQLAATFTASSPWYDPAGTVAITYIIKGSGVLQCHLYPFV
jgi:hypothetical protein